MQQNEYVLLVDEEDNVIGTCEKMEAHEKGLLHRAFSVFIFRKTNRHFEVLLQQRQNSKYHCPGLWTNTCCSHPREGETVIEAGQRRLVEEMGIETDLHHAGSFIYQASFDNGLTEYELDHVLVGSLDVDEFEINDSEVRDACWMNLSEVVSDLSAHPTKYTPWFSKALNVALKQQPLLEQVIMEAQTELA